VKSPFEKNIDFLFGEITAEVKDIKKSLKVACPFYIYKIA